ncbi:MAG: hypothetical protein LHV69_08745 [Elusimicrobia bacterium]|nr:hypothetical protein [Candidatus Obscuribacterium magneticum]
MFRPPSLAVFLFMAIAPLACTKDSTKNTAQSDEQTGMKKWASSAFFPDGCLQMVNTYCDRLYSPDALGNLLIEEGNTHVLIRKGMTENGFSQAYYEFAHAQIHFKNRLPRDFLSALKQQRFFERLFTHLKQKPINQMSLFDRVKSIRAQMELGAIWNSAISEVILLRMERLYPGFSKTRDHMISIELWIEKRRQRTKLLAEIYYAIWSKHPKWRDVEAQFEKIRTEYLNYIQENDSLPDDIKKDWNQRIKDVRLVLPGTDPANDMEICSQTEQNAYFFTNLNYLTICAGDFNTEEITQTLAHELSHALDIDRSFKIFEDNSRAGIQLNSFRNNLCENKISDCKAWVDFRDIIPEHLEQMKDFRVQQPALQRCLKGKETRQLDDDDEYIMTTAKQEVQEMLASSAERNIFLRLTKPDLPMPDGSMRKNPGYLNPCNYYDWPPESPSLDDEINLLVLFTMEYKCNPSGTSTQRMENAIETARKLHQEIIKAQIQMEGEFSQRQQLQADQYAASPAERFADRLGAEIFSRILIKNPDIQTRRALYLASNAWQCSRPSLERHFPEEAQIQRNYLVNPHSIEMNRRKELLPLSIRKALNCRKDFNLNECPF